MNLFRSTTTTPIACNSLNHSHFRRPKLLAGATCLLLTTICSSQAATFITFDVPSAVNGTTPTAINPRGTIAGFYIDANFVFHGFVRAPNCTFATFDPPNFVQTNPVAINPMGTITGWFVDATSFTFRAGPGWHYHHVSCPRRRLFDRTHGHQPDGNDHGTLQHPRRLRA